MFNKNKFMQCELQQRTETIKVDDLADFFDKDSDLVWEVRGLTASEMAKAQESASKNKNIMATIEAMVGNKQDEKIEALKEMLGTDDSVPVELAKRMEHLVSGSVNPEIDLSLAVKLAEYYPVVFMQLTTKILELTGLGGINKVKLKTSTKKTK